VIATQDIVFGVTGQSFLFDCPDGTPTAVVSVSVYEADADDTSQAVAATTGAGSVAASPDTTLAAAAGASEDDPKHLQLANATGVAVDRRYRVVGADGLHEDIEVASFSGVNVYAKHPLLNDYVSGATFKTMRCSIAVDATWVANISYVSPTCSPNPRYRLRWVVTLNGVSEVYDRYADLVRYPARHHVSPLDIEGRWPGFLDGLGPDQRHDQGRGVIDRAWRQLRADLWQDHKADHAMKNAEMVAELVASRTVLLQLEDVLLAGGDVDAARIDRATRIYRQRYDSLIRSPVMPMDTSGGASAPIRPKAWLER
jgi:hypothetical protein